MRPAVVLLVSLGSACAPTPALSSTPDSAVAVEPPPKRDAVEIPILGLELGLPRPPEFFVADLPILADDGTWSVRGLRLVLDEILPEADAGRVVLVSAYVQEVYQAPVCPQNQVCAPAKQPHAWIVDDPGVRGKQGAMLVTGIHFPIPEWDHEARSEWASEPELELEPGKRYVFIGWFRRFTESGFAHDRGLLELLAVANYPLRANARWIFPRNSELHPKARAQHRLAPLAPELARVPAGVVEGAPVPEPGPLVEPRNHAEALELGRAAEWDEHPLRADYYYRWLIVSDPSKALGWVELASMYLDNGEPEAGLAILDLALERSPDDPVLHSGRGRLLLNVGEPTAAIESYHRATELAPESPDAWFGLGIAHAELGQREGATEALQRFLDIAADPKADVPQHIIRAAEDTMMRMSYPD